MTVNNTASTIAFNGNGANTTFPFAMSLPDEGDLQVFVTDDLGVTRQLATSEYTVVLNPLSGTNPTPDGGTVTYNPSTGPLPVGWVLRLVRVLPQVQDTSISNQSIIYPPVIEQEFDYLTMLIQQGGFTLDRSLKVPLGDPLPQDLPPQADRINQTAFFDGNGDLTAGTPLDGTIMVSAAMQPVVQASTLQEAQTLFGLNKDPRLVTGTYTLVGDDDRRTVSLQGSAFYTVSVGPPASYPSYFVGLIVNNDNRAKTVSVSGFGLPFLIYPMQQVWLSNGPSGWLVSRPGRWFTRVPQQFYVDPVLGSDTSDGLAVGSGAFQTIARAVKVVETDVDGDFTINLANGTHNVGDGVTINKRLPGGNAYKIVGNTTDPSQCIVVLNATTVASSFKIAIRVVDGAVADVRGIQMQGGGGPGGWYCLWCINTAVLTISDITFAPAPQTTTSAHIVCWGAVMNIVGTIRISGGSHAAYHLGAFYNGVVTYNVLGGTTPIQVILTGSVAFPSGFFLSELNSTIINISQVNSYPNAGFAFSTPKAAVVYNAICNVGGAAVPGDLPANVSNGGFFF